MKLELELWLYRFRKGDLITIFYNMAKLEKNFGKGAAVGIYDSILAARIDASFYALGG